MPQLKKVSVINSHVVDDHTVYQLKVNLTDAYWCVDRRYSEFYALNEVLTKQHGVGKGLLPGRRLIGSQRQSVIEERKDGLGSYIDHVCQLLDPLPTCVQEFLDFQQHNPLSITYDLARYLYRHGDQILASRLPVRLSALQLFSVTQRLVLEAPPTEHGDKESDIGHLFDVVYCLESLEVVGTGKKLPDHRSHLTQDLELFKSVTQLLLDSCDLANMVFASRLKDQLQSLSAHHSISSCQELLQGWPSPGISSSPWSCLVTLDLQKNNITAIDDSVTLLPHVEQLNLSSNHIRVIEHLQLLPRLRWLNLAHNEISNLNTLHLHIGNVTTLILQDNCITSLAGLHRVFSLEHINVSYNQLHQLGDISALRHLPSLEEVELKGNPLCGLPKYRLVVLSCLAPQVVLDKHETSARELKELSRLSSTPQSARSAARSTGTADSSQAVATPPATSAGTATSPSNASVASGSGRLAARTPYRIPADTDADADADADADGGNDTIVVKSSTTPSTKINRRVHFSSNPGVASDQAQPSSATGHGKLVAGLTKGGSEDLRKKLDSLRQEGGASWLEMLNELYPQRSSRSVSKSPPNAPGPTGLGSSRLRSGKKGSFSLTTVPLTPAVLQAVSKQDTPAFQQQLRQAAEESRKSGKSCNFLVVNHSTSQQVICSVDVNKSLLLEINLATGQATNQTTLGSLQSMKYTEEPCQINLTFSLDASSTTSMRQGATGSLAGTSDVSAVTEGKANAQQQQRHQEQEQDEQQQQQQLVAEERAQLSTNKAGDAAAGTVSLLYDVSCLNHLAKLVALLLPWSLAKSNLCNDDTATAASRNYPLFPVVPVFNHTLQLSRDDADSDTADAPPQQLMPTMEHPALKKFFYTSIAGQLGEPFEELLHLDWSSCQRYGTDEEYPCCVFLSNVAVHLVRVVSWTVDDSNRSISTVTFSWLASGLLAQITDVAVGLFGSALRLHSTTALSGCVGLPSGPFTYSILTRNDQQTEAFLKHLRSTACEGVSGSSTATASSGTASSDDGNTGAGAGAAGEEQASAMEELMATLRADCAGHDVGELLLYKAVCLRSVSADGNVSTTPASLVITSNAVALVDEDHVHWPRLSNATLPPSTPRYRVLAAYPRHCLALLETWMSNKYHLPLILPAMQPPADLHLQFEGQPLSLRGILPPAAAGRSAGVADDSSVLPVLTMPSWYIVTSSTADVKQVADTLASLWQDQFSSHLATADYDSHDALPIANGALGEEAEPSPGAPSARVADGGQVFQVLSYYSDHLSHNPGEQLHYLCQCDCVRWNDADAAYNAADDPHTAPTLGHQQEQHRALFLLSNSMIYLLKHDVTALRCTSSGGTTASSSNDTSQQRQPQQHSDSGGGIPTIDAGTEPTLGGASGERSADGSLLSTDVDLGTCTASSRQLQADLECCAAESSPVLMALPLRDLRHISLSVFDQSVRFEGELGASQTVLCNMLDGRETNELIDHVLEVLQSSCHYSAASTPASPAPAPATQATTAAATTATAAAATPAATPAAASTDVYRDQQAESGQQQQQQQTGITTTTRSLYDDGDATASSMAALSLELDQELVINGVVHCHWPQPSHMADLHHTLQVGVSIAQGLATEPGSLTAQQRPDAAPASIAPRSTGAGAGAGAGSLPSDNDNHLLYYQRVCLHITQPALLRHLDLGHVSDHGSCSSLPCCLVVTDSRVYLIVEDNLHWPIPSFLSDAPSGREQYVVLASQPLQGLHSISVSSFGGNQLQLNFKTSASNSAARTLFSEPAPGTGTGSDVHGSQPMPATPASAAPAVSAASSAASLGLASLSVSEPVPELEHTGHTGQQESRCSLGSRGTGTSLLPSLLDHCWSISLNTYTQSEKLVRILQVAWGMYHDVQLPVSKCVPANIGSWSTIQPNSTHSPGPS